MIFFVYRCLIKPALFALSGPHQQCRYPVSCSEYAKTQFLQNSFPAAVKNSFLRVLSCNPWNVFNMNRTNKD